MFTEEELGFLNLLILKYVDYGGSIDEMEMCVHLYHKINQKKKQ